MGDEFGDSGSLQISGSLALPEKIGSRTVATLTEAQLEEYTAQVAVEKTSSGFYGEDGYYYYYVYDTGTADKAEAQTERSETAGNINEEGRDESNTETPQQHLKEQTAPSARFKGYVSLPASASAQESESYLARIRDWVDLDKVALGTNAVSPADASVDLENSRIVDVMKAKAILNYLMHETDRWEIPPIETEEGAVVANLRIPTFEELRRRLKYEDLDEPTTDLQSQPSLGHEWDRIQTEVQLSMAMQADRARRASVAQQREENRRSLDVLQQRRISNLLFLVPPS
eukprot:Gregarina_sp_Poly_1__10516@NODE_773_length_6343_cov_143_248247_g568_i0_p4_GENE_NODE_773_length_6343_cov_143_248247_g568_i0NODE_773_length_6343_cov_143_248247_g568_i0_p4_ORF_typecomplete_len287_score54_73DUF4718/PF15842_5/0_22_NODE_773_length_6343_cov_143_248247_g568_i039104770